MAAGDEAALRQLYARHGRRLFAYAYRITGSAEVAEEVVQESLLAAWHGAGRFRGDGRAIAWLLGIVHRQALNATRRKQYPTVSLDDAAQPAGDADPLDHAASAERDAALGAALAELSVDHRAAIELVFYHGLSMAEAAQVCGCPPGTIKSRLSYAKNHLRGILARAGLRREEL